ncbi:MAG: PKD domain-containing protein, partial [Verrucomicrobia bacterium]|nr:PKD domain-containing protein [Verrucomicrobiota bacterium]
ALYMIEYGDQWWENNDSRVVRLVYRRGNRTPVGKLTASETAGRHPLSIQFDASQSWDADGDELSYLWHIDNRAVTMGSHFDHTFHEPGNYEVGLTVIDPGRASHTTTQSIQVGNSRPRISFTQPTHGSFFDWEKEISYRVEVSDEDSENINPALVSVLGEYRNRAHLSGDEEVFVVPGLALMRKSTCFACHLSDAPSAGPSYEQVALKYANDPNASERLAHKILTGGSGIWGELPMPPHPQHNIDQTRQMVAWVLSLTHSATHAPKLGATGTWTPPARANEENWTVPPEPGEGIRTDGGVFVLTADYTDAGFGSAPPLRGESSIILHSRRKKAALYDDNTGMEYVEKVDGEEGILGYFEDGDFIVWRELNLDNINSILVRAGSLGNQRGQLELRAGSPEGDLLARIEIKPTGQGEFNEIPAKLNYTSGLTDVCVVGRFNNPAGQILGLNWIEFQLRFIE